MKRTFDIIMSAIGLIVLSPLLTAVTVAVFLQDRSNPYFTQERCGMGTTRFQLIKFRTMTNGKHIIKDYSPGDDNRVTPVGRFLRQYHLDELPNLINILKGDMSFVGPRPMPFEVDQELDPGYANTYEILGWEVRNSVMPGVTGVAQLKCPKMASRERKFCFDITYVWNRSMWFDIVLIGHTLKLIILRLLAIRVTLSLMAFLFLLLAMSGIVMAVDEFSNVISDRSIVPDSIGAMAFAIFGLVWLILFMMAVRGKR